MAIEVLAVMWCRLESVRLVLAAGGGDDPLDNEEQLADQMDSLPFLARFQYEATAEYLAGLFDPLAIAYKVCRIRSLF